MEAPGGGDQEDQEEAGRLRGRPQQGHQPTFQGDLDLELLQVYKIIRLEECVENFIFLGVSTLCPSSHSVMCHSVEPQSLPLCTRFTFISNSNSFDCVLFPQWMPNGSLEERLKKETGREPLTWRQR